MSFKYDLGVIGCGNMGGAMLAGILEAGIVTRDKVIASRSNKAGRRALKTEFEGICVTSDNNEISTQSRIILIGVKPKMVESVLAGIKDDISTEQIIISVAAGVDIETIASALGDPEVSRLKIVRTLPNTAAKVRESMTAYHDSGTLSNEELNEVLTLLQACGMVRKVPAHLMDAATAVGGSSPAFVYMFIEAMADGAVAMGMRRKDANEFAAQAVLGAAKMALEDGRCPGELKDSICSPGGSTIEGVLRLEKGAFRGAVMEAIMDVAKKSGKLNEK